jgi:hypothetical protein
MMQLIIIFLLFCISIIYCAKTQENHCPCVSSSRLDEWSDFKILESLKDSSLYSSSVRNIHITKFYFQRDLQKNFDTHVFDDGCGIFWCSHKENLIEIRVKSSIRWRDYGWAVPYLKIYDYDLFGDDKIMMDNSWLGFPVVESDRHGFGCLLNLNRFTKGKFECMVKHMLWIPQSCPVCLEGESYCHTL